MDSKFRLTSKDGGDFAEFCAEGVWVEVQMLTNGEPANHAFYAWEPGQRRTLLAHLLSADAAERVEKVPSSVWSPRLSAYDTGLRFVCDDASVSLSSCGVLRLEGARLDCSEASNLILCLAAALDEKRRRDVSDA